MKRRTTAFLFLLITTFVFAQDKKNILLTIDETPIYTSEFKRVYKKNLELVQEESQKSVDSYLDLFIDYKLKIAEAKTQGFDKDDGYVREFAKYQEQLSRNYIYEDKFNEEVAKEAYDRGLEQIDAHHILIRTTYNDTPQDTLVAYNKIKSVREKALAGEDFEMLAKTYSEEPGAKERAGHLGYFSAFSMVYPFENMAYNTPKGEVSEIVRTQFGYHIIKINDRRERGNQIEVSHIMVSHKKEDSTFNARERIADVYALLQQGSSFENLAEQYSDDKNSARRGGKLRPIRRGDLRAPKFEDAAFELQNKGDISKPIESSFGWHIIRLEKTSPPPTFEEEKEQLLKRVKEGTRSKRVTAAINNQIKDKYGFTLGSDYRSYFNNLITDSIVKRKWEYEGIPTAEDKVLFTIGEKEARFSEFAEYINTRQKKARMPTEKGQILIQMFDEFETKVLKDYFKERLEVENEEYAGIINEYRDGLLIFDVMNANVWDKARQDSLGLERYFEKTRDAYKWKTRARSVILLSNDRAAAERAKELLEQNVAADSIKTQLSSNTVKLLVTSGTFETGWREFPDNFDLKEGVSQVYEQGGSFVVVNVEEVIPPGPKTLDDVRGKVLSGYQNLVEEQWIESLRSKYKVEVNKKALKRVKKELSS